MPQAFLGLAQFVVQVGEALTTKVLQLHPFQVVPDPLGRVQFRRVAGELLQVNPPAHPASGPEMAGAVAAALSQEKAERRRSLCPDFLNASHRTESQRPIHHQRRAKIGSYR